MIRRISLLVAIICAVSLMFVSLASAQQDAQPGGVATPQPPAAVPGDAAASGTTAGAAGPTTPAGGKTTRAVATRPASGGASGAEAGEGKQSANETVRGTVDTGPNGHRDWFQRFGDWVRRDAIGASKKLGLALVFFLLGWLLAKFLAWTFFRLLRRTNLDERVFKRLGLSAGIERKGAPPHQTERIAATVVFWMLMLMVVIATLQYAGLSQAAKPIQTFIDRIAGAMPLIGKAILILLVAYVAGLALGKLVTRFLDQSRIDERFILLTTKRPDDGAAEADDAAVASEDDAAVDERRPFSEAAGRVTFWLMMVIGLAGAVDALQIGPLATGLRNAIDQIISWLPQLGLALLLAASGYVLGRIARAMVGNLLDSAGFNTLAQKAKLNRILGERKASDVAGIFAMVFVVLQLGIAALNELELRTLSEPLTQMMAQFWNALPMVGVAMVIMFVGAIAARIIRGIVETGLDNLGFSEWMDKLGVSALAERSKKLQKPHQLIGLIVYVAIILLASVQALEKLELQRWASYVNGFLIFSVVRVSIAFIIVGIGLGVANYVRDLILARRRDESDEGVRWMALFARYGILVFAVCMAVHHLEIGDNFVLITFSLLFGSLCFALALSFGLGAREVAGEIVRRQYERARGELSERASAPPDDSDAPSV